MIVKKKKKRKKKSFRPGSGRISREMRLYAGSVFAAPFPGN